MRKPTKGEAHLLRLMDSTPDMLCHEFGRWWIDCGGPVPPQIAEGVLAAGWIEQTSGPIPLSTLTRTPAGRTALQSVEETDRAQSSTPTTGGPDAL